MIVINDNGDIDMERERCECRCGCRTIASYWDLLWVEYDNAPVDITDLADPNAVLAWRLVCARCCQNLHSVYELAVIAVGQKEK